MHVLLVHPKPPVKNWVYKVSCNGYCLSTIVHFFLVFVPGQSILLNLLLVGVACVLKPAAGGHQGEWGEWGGSVLVSGAGSPGTAQEPGAGCRDIKCLHLHQTRRACVHDHEQTDSWTRRLRGASGPRVGTKSFLPLCVCKLSTKWDSLLSTVKIWGSRACWDAWFVFTGGVEHCCPSLLLPGFCLKPDTGSEDSGIPRNLTVAAQLQLLSQPKILNS